MDSSYYWVPDDDNVWELARLNGNSATSPNSVCSFLTVKSNQKVICQLSKCLPSTQSPEEDLGVYSEDLVYLHEVSEPSILNAISKFTISICS
jgi:hypothetical protein